MPSLATLFPRNIGEVLQKSEDEISIDAGAAGHELAEGSYERVISLVAQPTCRACPCPGASEWGMTDLDGNWHYTTVFGTFEDHVIVGCTSCDRFWKVPYEITDEDGRATVMVGKPEPRVRAFMAPEAAVEAQQDPPFEPEADKDPAIANAVPLIEPEG